jgi:hypothetical protein
MKSWRRRHKNGTITALVIAQEATEEYLIAVMEPPGEARIPHNFLEKESEQAKSGADAIIQKHYPHVCEKAECEDWQPAFEDT